MKDIANWDRREMEGHRTSFIKQILSTDTFISSFDG